jgi:hypothetical protein
MELHNLKLKLHDHFPNIVIERHDEQRVVDLLKMATSQDAELGQLKSWNASHGLDLKTQSSPSEWREYLGSLKTG